jgi:hypothetical protein
VSTELRDIDDPNTVIGRMRAAEKMMTTPLVKISEKITKARTKVESCELEGHWEIAQLIAKVELDPAVYGTDAIDLLKERHGFDNRALTNYKSVSQRIPKELYEKALEHNKGERGTYHRVTFTHLVQVARLKDDEDKTEMYDRVVDEEMSALATREAVKEAIVHGEAEQATAARAPQAGAIVRGIASGATKLTNALANVTSGELGIALVAAAAKPAKYQQVSVEVTALQQTLAILLDTISTAITTLEENVATASGVVIENSNRQAGREAVVSDDAGDGEDTSSNLFSEDEDSSIEDSLFATDD